MLQNLSNFYGIRWFDFYSALVSNFSAIRKLSFVKKFQMLFEQNIASNVTRNQKYKHLTNSNIAKERPSTPKHNYWHHVETF